MKMHDGTDPDVYRWGLHHLFSSYPNCTDGCYRSVTTSGTRCDDGISSIEGSSVAEGTSTENDAVIAHALQEELSQVAIEEASGSSTANEEHLQAAILAQDWYGSSVRNINSEEGEHEEREDIEPSSSCSSPEANICGGEQRSLELLDESDALDGEVRKRLIEMVPVPHVPKINGEVPTVDEATSDYERLLDRLRLYDLVELKVKGDGNCQFRALSDQLYGSPEHHKFVRQQIVNQLKCHADIYEGYVPMSYGDYLKHISKDGEWGDHVTLQAAADSYGVKIFIITSFKDTCYVEIMPSVQKSKRVIFLSFWAEVHYNSIYPEGDFPILHAKKKKRWWHFGHRY